MKFVFVCPKAPPHFPTLAITATHYRQTFTHTDSDTQRQMQQPPDMLPCRHPDMHGLEAACKVVPVFISAAMTQSLPDMQQYTPTHMNTVVPVRLRARVEA